LNEEEKDANDYDDDDNDEEVIWTGHLSDSGKCIIQWFPATVTQYRNTE